MPSTPSSIPGSRTSLGILLAGLLLFSWWLGIKNAVMDLVSPAEETAKPRTPNILLIVADDLGYNDTSAMNGSGLPTPNLDQLAREGVVFRRHYADATCTPSRVAIMTGRYPERSGFRPVGSEIPPEFPTIAEQLKAGGYNTYLTGKWHAGEGRTEAWPQHKGFERWFGFLNQWETAGEVVESDKGRVKPTYHNPMLRQDGGELVPFSGHLTEILTEHTLQKLEQLQGSDQPWFLYHAFLAPHHPIQPAAEYAARFPDTPEGRYTALVTQLDQAIGRIISAVDRDNTLVVFVSDNGGTNAERDNNFPFFGSKSEMFEGAFRTPLIISWPGEIPRGKAVEDVVMNVDLYPTLMAAAKLPAPEDLDGLNLWPIFRHDGALPPRSRGWEVYSANVNTLSFSFLSREGNWRLANPQGLNHSLYDLATDISGKQDVISTHAQRVPDLAEAFWQDQWQKSQVAAVARPGISDEQTLYSGFDVMRTPQRYGFAIGLELGPLPAPTWAGGEGQALAGQEGVWSLHYVTDQGVQWRLGDNVLEDAHFDPRRCNALVLTGYFEPKAHLAKREPRSELKLYSSGALSDSRRDVPFGTLGNADLQSPTFVNHGGRARFANIMLSSYSDSYVPRLKSQFVDFYESAFREKQLSLVDVSRMTAELCR